MMRMRHVKLLAAVTIVLVTLSGFSPSRTSGGRGGGKSHTSGGSGGGGCSSKKSSSHSGTSSSYDSGRSDRYDSGYGDGYRRGSRYKSTNGSTGSGSSGGGSSRGSRSATGSLVECAARTQASPSATVLVRNSGSRSGTYTVTVNFRDTAGSLLDSGSAVATVRGDSTKRVKVRMDDPSLVSRVRTCEVRSVR